MRAYKPTYRPARAGRTGKKNSGPDAARSRSDSGAERPPRPSASPTREGRRAGRKDLAGTGPGAADPSTPSRQERTGSAGTACQCGADPPCARRQLAPCAVDRACRPTAPLQKREEGGARPVRHEGPGGGGPLPPRSHGVHPKARHATLAPRQQEALADILISYD